MNKESDKLLVFGVLPMVFILFAMIMPKTGPDGDMQYWVNWSRELQLYGISNAYSGDINYPPVFLYVLNLFGYMQGSPEEILKKINYLKSIVLLFDFLGIYICIYFLRLRNISPLYSLLILFNVAYLYNTMVWGQVDCIHTVFSLAAVLLASQGFVILSLVSFVVAFNMKLQAIIFFPLLVLIIWPYLIHIKKLLLSITTVVFTQALILTPFILGGKVMEFWNMVEHSVGFFPVVSMCAHNFWNLALWAKYLTEVSNELTWSGVSYKNWGTLMFCIASFFVLFPILSTSLIRFINGEKKSDLNYEKSLLLAGGMIALVFFYFNTEMHERYSHPAILFIGLYALLNKDYIIYILASVAYFLNMEFVLRSLQLHNYSTLTFDPRFISSLFLLCLVLGLFKLYSLNMANIKNLFKVLGKVVKQKSFKNISQAV